MSGTDQLMFAVVAARAKALAQEMVLKAKSPAELCLATVSLVVTLKTMEARGDLPKGMLEQLQRAVEDAAKYIGVMPKEEPR